MRYQDDAHGVHDILMIMTNTIKHFPEPRFARFLFGDTRFSLVWIVLRLYVGYEWLMAGWEKVTSPLWAGPQAGTALSGFLAGAAKKAMGSHPDVGGWYLWFINHAVVPHPAVFSYLVSYGELLVGAALIAGAFVGVAAFAGLFMNFNYLFAGTISTNPLLILLEAVLMLAWRNAGWIGLDRWLLPKLGVPWKVGEIFETKTRA